MSNKPGDHFTRYFINKVDCDCDGNGEWGPKASYFWWLSADPEFAVANVRSSYRKPEGLHEISVLLQILDQNLFVKLNFTNVFTFFNPINWQTLTMRITLVRLCGKSRSRSFDAVRYSFVWGRKQPASQDCDYAQTGSSHKPQTKLSQRYSNIHDTSQMIRKT